MPSLADERQRRLVVDSLWLGIVGAASAQIFMFLLDLVQELMLKGIAGYLPPGLPAEGGVLEEMIGAHHLWLIPVVTTLGGLISGWLVFTFAPGAEGDGTDSVVHVFHRAGGLINARVPPLKTIASAITIGSGGSAGREGPTSLISAGIGSVYGTMRQRPEEERKLLTVIGMTAGLSAIFRTPIGAAIYAIEVLYSDMEFETSALLYAILSSVVAYTINGWIVGWEPLFRVPADLTLSSASDYGEYAVLGLLGGVIAALMPVVFYRTRDIFHQLRVPPFTKPAIGGLLVGLMALAWPQVLSGGYGWMQDALDGKLTLSLMFILVFAKMLATSLTVASGGSGGVFAPSLFVGAMLGGVMAHIFNQSYPAFVLGGMAAVFSGAGRVPIATLFMVTELTEGYHLLPAAALVVSLSYMVEVTLTAKFKYKSLYESQIPVRRGRDVDLLEGVTVADTMTQEFDSVLSTMPLKTLVDEFERTHHHGFTVVDEEGRLFGIVTLGDLENAMMSESLEDKTVADVATVEGLAVGYPDESVGTALWRMGVRGIGRLPIVDRHDSRKLVGVLRRENIIDAYEHAMARRTYTSFRLKELREAHEGNVRVVEVDVNNSHKLAGKRVKDLAVVLPEDCILVSLRRGNKVIIPHGDTVIQAGDHLVTLTGASCVNEATAALNDPAIPIQSPPPKTEDAS